MNLVLKTIFFAACIATINCLWINKHPSLKELASSHNQHKNESASKHTTTNNNSSSALITKLSELVHSGNNDATAEQNQKNQKNQTTNSRQKRQLGFAGGLGVGFGAYDYNDYYGDYVSDYAYDYYDWICSEASCQLCNILTSECCDPSVDINCFLPDSCLNNPCLSGGTCVTSKTLDGQPDFICICLPGLTGKYCQVVNDYFVGAEVLPPPFMPTSIPIGMPMPEPAPMPAPAPAPAYQAPAPAYAAPAPQYAQPAPQYAQPAPQYAQPAAPQYAQPAAPQYAQPAAPQYAQPAAPQYAQQAPQYSQQAAPQYANGAPQSGEPMQQQQQQQQQFAPQQMQPMPVQQTNLAMSMQPGQMQGSDGRFVRTLGAKGIKCSAGKIYNAALGECADFALSKKD